MTTSPRLFHLQRDRDISGVSGTGRVADGVLWSDGTVAIRWIGDRPSTVHWDRLGDAEHVHGHGGATRIVWATETQPADQPALLDRIADAVGRTNLPMWHKAARYEAAAAVLAVLPEPVDQAAIRAAALREAADRYAKLTDQNEAYDREQGELDQTARLQYGTVRDLVVGLRRMADEPQPASSAPLASGLPLVQGNCPACGSSSLFLGDGGYVTCSRIDCPEPDAATTVLERRATAGARQDGATS